MSDKWSELLQGAEIRHDGMKLEGGASPMEASSAFSGWALLLPIAVVAIVAMVVASTGSKAAKTPALKSVADLEAPLTVVQSTAVPDNGLKAVAVEDPRGAPVGPRNTARAFFSYEEDDVSGIQKPFENNESGFSYSDFERALQQGREKPVLDRPVPANAKTLSVQAAGMKAFVERNGMTLESFAENNSYLPEEMYEAWDYKAPAPRAARQETTDESLMLARDAMQMVPTNVPEAAIVPVLREILAARTEAATAGLSLPAITEEQRDALGHWSASRTTTASALASNILSRVAA